MRACSRNGSDLRLYLAFSLRVAADLRAPSEERQAAVEFLPIFWVGDDPDESTAALLNKLEEERAGRTLPKKKLTAAQRAAGKPRISDHSDDIPF